MSRRVRVIALPRFRLRISVQEQGPPPWPRDYVVEYDEQVRQRMWVAANVLRRENVEVRALVLGLRAYLSYLAYQYVFVRDHVVEEAVLACMHVNRDVRDEFFGCDVLLDPTLDDDSVHAVADGSLLLHAVTERLEKGA